ncbi:MAG: right-handed parallel beta-helix repeat-containing protein [Akkermansiaceae bacterium]|nr:right-handed parallel beta-helix repeat-containing protein [Akkermansiaceae bacterium]
MTLTEARKILGLGPDEDPRPHLDEFRAVRERIADMVRTAANEMLAARYQEGLVEFDRALAAVREYLEALGLIARVADVKVDDNAPAERGHAVFVEANEVKESIGLPVVSQPLPGFSDEDDSESATGRVFRVVAWSLLLLLSLICFGGWMYLKVEEERELNKQARVAFLERQGAIFIENRRWPEAEEAFAEIEGIYPQSALVSPGRRSIEAGMTEEQNQFIGYWKGEAIAAFEASRWDDAEKAARQVLDMYPDEKEINALISRIGVTKQEEERQEVFARVRKSIADRDFDRALSDAQSLAARDTEDTEAADLLREANRAKDKAEADLMRARELAAMAADRDTGKFDEESINWMREALALAPNDEPIKARYEKMASYTRTIRVPEDVKTVTEALSKARDRDRVVLAEGIWEGPFVIAAGVELEGVSGKTIVQCAADAGSALSFLPGVKGARISGLTIRHLSFDAGAERFSLAHVRGAEVNFSDCRFEQGSGHGIAVTAGGHAKVSRCRITENGWNGIAVTGSGSLLEAEKNILKGNFQNGIESWDGAAVILANNECTGNSRNGIHVDCGAASVTALGNTLSGNREFGMVITSAGAGEITGNTMEKNMLGGMVVKSGGAKVQVKGNGIRSNKGPGLVLEKGIPENAFTGNTLSGNTGDQLMSGVDLSTAD